MRVGFLASFSSVSKFLTDRNICNEAYSVIADEGDILFQLQVFDLTDEVFRLFYPWACVSLAG